MKGGHLRWNYWLRPDISEYDERIREFLVLRPRPTWYRGKTSAGRWIYGHGHADSGSGWIYAYVHDASRTEAPLTEVEPATLGACTGVFDVDDHPIYQDDIIEPGPDPDYEGSRPSLAVVIYRPDKGGFFIRHPGTPLAGRLLREDINRFNMRVKGNIFDNPELLDQEEGL